VAATFDEAEGPGAVFTWGNAANNRLGYVVDEGTVQPDPKRVPWLTAALGDILRARREGNGKASGSTRRKSSMRLAQRISQLGCGSRHTVVLCQGGLICFGADDFGQLGRPSGSQQLIYSDEAGGSVELPPFASVPALPPGQPLDDVAAEELRSRGAGSGEATTRRISCGPLHSAAVSAEGRLHVWGLRLLPTHDEQPTLDAGSGVRQVPGFGMQRPVVALACGAHFVVVSAEVELARVTGAKVETRPRRRGPAWSTVGPAVEEAWRPSNLPPKDEEERLHHRNLVRELERSAQRRIEQEQREDEKRRAREEQREKRLQEHTEIWLRQLLPSFVPGSRPSRRMERLWRQGLPPRVREVLWPTAIGNVLRITPELFEIYKQQALDARRAQAEAASSNVLVTLSEPSRGLGKEHSTECIPFDLPRTFPTLAFFCEGGPLHEDCARILEAYTFFRPDIGYVQGMSFLAAVLLLYLPPYQAFVGLCNLLNTPSVLGLYRMVPQNVQCRSQVFLKLCAMQMPAVASCIEEAGLTPEMFLIEWFMTIYSKCLQIDVASVIWDLFLLDGEVVLYCTGLALLRISEPALLGDDGSSLEGCARILGEELRARVNDPEELLWHVHEVWRKAPVQLLEEIRSIENTEFGPPPVANHPNIVAGSGGSSASSISAAPATRQQQSVLSSLRESLKGSWFLQ